MLILCHWYNGRQKNGQTGSNLVRGYFLDLNFEPEFEAGDRYVPNFHIFVLFYCGQVIFSYGVVQI